MKYRVNTIEEYNSLLSKGIEPLACVWVDVEHDLRVEAQKRMFGGNNATGNGKFYRFCLKHRAPVCEECGKPINHPTAINVSHILTRGAYPEMAHDIRNINILCPAHHAKWENGDRENMRIYPKNKIMIAKLKNEYQNKD